MKSWDLLCVTIMTNKTQAFAGISMEPSSSYRPDIDGLRAIAVLAVLFHHLEVSGFSGGFVGVDVFFVISGFLITRIIVTEVSAGTFKFSRFYARRLRRLLPALLFTLLMTMVFGFLLLSPEHLIALAKSGLFSLAWISNFLFYDEVGYFDIESRFKPLLHTWSLSVEEQYYLIWPALLVALLGRRRQWLALTGMLTLLVGGFAVSAVWLALDPAGAFFLLPARIFEFAVGGLLVWITPKYRPSPAAREITTVLGLAMIAAPVILYTPLTPFPGIAALVPCIGAALLIYGGEARFAGQVLSNPVSVGVGKISYSLYLIHWPLIVYFEYWKFGEIEPLDKSALFVVAIAMAWLMFKLVETPFRRPVGWTWIPHHWHPRAAIMSMVCIAALSVTLGLWNGMLWRIDIVQNIDPRPVETLRENCMPLAIPVEIVACVVGDVSVEPQFAIVGDSHAQSLALGFDEIGKASHQSAILLTQGGAVPFIGARTNDARGFLIDDFDETFAYLRDHGPETIIINARFAMYWWTDRGKITPANRLKYVGLLDGTFPDSVAESQANFVSTLRHTIETLNEFGKRAILVGAFPHLGVDVLSCLSRPTYLISLDTIAKQCQGFTREQALGRTNGVNAVLADATRGTRVAFIDPTDWFCPESMSACRRVFGDQLLYRDDNHLSNSGAVAFFNAYPEVLAATSSTVAESPSASLQP